MDIEERRRVNFFRILRESYGDSPKQFEIKTGYSANMVSQLRSKNKDFGERVARKIEELAGWPEGMLDEPSPDLPAEIEQRRATDWPLSADRGRFEQLTPKRRRELDEAFTHMLNGAFTAQMLDQPVKRAAAHKKQRQAQKREQQR